MSEKELKKIRVEVLNSYMLNVVNVIDNYKECLQENKQLKEKNKEQSLLLIEFQQMEYERDLYKSIVDEYAKEILKELKENHHLSYGVALSIRQKLLNYEEILDKVKESE